MEPIDCCCVASFRGSEVLQFALVDAGEGVWTAVYAAEEEVLIEEMSLLGCEAAAGTEALDAGLDAPVACVQRV